MKDGKFLVLGIETSCDETACSVITSDREVLSNIISSQIDIHKVYGGVVPEIASRHHLEDILPVLKKALKEANVTIDEIDLIGATKGPGLIGALIIGVATAKALSFTKDIPLCAVNHTEGHISAAYLEKKDLEPPFLSLVVSGGHTKLIAVDDYNKFRVLGETRDDAAGEAFDKVARVLGLEYPGGPNLDLLAKKGKRDAVFFKRVMLEKDSLDFSFSGIKTSVMNYINNEKNIIKADIAASFQEAIVDVLVEKAKMALELTNYDKLVMAGGVASNSRLRARLEEESLSAGFSLICPAKILCTDNAAMIAMSAYYRYKEGFLEDYNMDADASYKMNI